MPFLNQHQPINPVIQVEHQYLFNNVVGKSLKKIGIVTGQSNYLKCTCTPIKINNIEIPDSAKQSITSLAPSGHRAHQGTFPCLDNEAKMKENVVYQL
jgi:hypothetical protein